jgi:hypothetical protein
MKNIYSVLSISLIAIIISLLTLFIQTTSNVICTNLEPCIDQEYYIQWGWPIPFMIDTNSMNDGHRFLKLDITGDDFKLENFLGDIAIYIIVLNGILIGYNKIRKNNS